MTIAESEAERVVKLGAMVDELSSLALEKVKQGDEKAAREALKEKKLTQELLSRVEERSLSNYRLASTIGTKIAASMTERRMMQDATPGESVSPSASTTTSSEPESPVSISSTWQENLEEAKARVYQEQLKAEGAGLRAKARVDELVPKFTKVREKIKKQAADDLNEALERVRQSPKSPAESILDARERLRASDRETMAEIRLVMEKKRKGEYVSNEEIDWAFQMMDKLI